jgi:cytochrome P450
MCRNEAWLEASKAYTVTSFVMALKMAAIPQALKFLVPWFSKEAKVVRQHLEETRTILTPLMNQRKSIKAEARKNGKPEPVYNDMIEWYEQESQGFAYDPAVYQTVLSMAAIHTTSELLSHTMMLLADEPQYVEALREEIIQVLRTEGLTKSALANLKLVDSTFKETQRFRPSTFRKFPSSIKTEIRVTNVYDVVSMRREAKQKVVLPDGTTINKGEQIAVDGFSMQDPDVYSDPETYDIYRYYRMRQDPATANKAHLVSTGPDNLSFGHGAQSCPGRFFAANEMKIALSHLLLKYDWELAPEASLEPKHVFGEMTHLDSNNKLRFRRRKEEVDLENLAYT